MHRKHPYRRVKGRCWGNGLGSLVTCRHRLLAPRRHAKGGLQEQIRYFKAHYELIQRGNYFRLTSGGEDFTAWQFSAPDQSEALMELVLTHSRANAVPLHLTLKGLEAQARYRIADYRAHGDHPISLGCDSISLAGQVYSGSALMYAGITLPQLFGDYPSVQLHFVRIS